MGKINLTSDDITAKWDFDGDMSHEVEGVIKVATIGPYDVYRGHGEYHFLPTEYEASTFTITQKGLEKLLRYL